MSHHLPRFPKIDFSLDVSQILAILALTKLAFYRYALPIYLAALFLKLPELLTILRRLYRWTAQRLAGKYQITDNATVAVSPLLSDYWRYHSANLRM